MTLAQAIAKAVELAPCSNRALCREAGVDPSHLNRIIAGEKNPTPEIAAKLEAALVEWQRRCTKAAELMRNANREAR